MAKRVSAIRQAYQKEYRRIDRALLKIRSQGYDISDLKLPDKEPKRVTKKALEELQSITPKKLRAKAIYRGYVPPKGTPLRTDNHFTSQEEAYARWVRIRDQRKQTLTAEQRIQKQKESNLRWLEEHGYYDTTEPEPTSEPSYGYYDDITEQERAEFQYEAEEEPQPEPTPELHETYPSIEGNEVVYRDIVTGEIVDRSPLSIETTDEIIIYMDGYTGDIIKEEPNVYGYQGYDATELALDNVRGIIDSMPAGMAKHFNALLDRMIDKHGENAVGNAIQALETKNGKSILESLQSAPNAYDEMIEIFSEIIEELPFTDEEREALRIEYSLHEPFPEVT